MAPHAHDGRAGTITKREALPGGRYLEVGDNVRIVYHYGGLPEYVDVSHPVKFPLGKTWKMRKSSIEISPHPDNGRPFRLTKDYIARHGLKFVSLHAGDEGIIKKHVGKNESELEVAVPARREPSLTVPKTICKIYHVDDGYPYRARHQYTNPQNGKILVERGDEGQVFDHSPNDGGRYVRVSNPHRLGSENVVVPKSAIEVGKLRKFGDWVGTPEKPDTTQVRRLYGHLLYDTLLAFFQAIKANIEKLQVISQRLVNALGTAGDDRPVEQLCNKILKGIENAGLRDSFHANFTWKSLLQTARTVEPSASLRYPDDKDCVGGVYIVENSDWKDKQRQSPLPEAQVGSTKHFPARGKGHIDDSAKKMSPFYKSWRASNTHSMYVFSKVSPSEDAELVRFATELFYMNALETYVPWLADLTISQENFMSAEISEEEEAEDEKSAIPPPATAQIARDGAGNARSTPLVGLPSSAQHSFSFET